MPIPYIGVSFGLLEHRQRMGPAWWLYFFLHTRANFRDPKGEVTFTPDEAAVALNADKRTIRRWYSHLKAERYIEHIGDDTRRERRIRITKYKSVPLMSQAHASEPDNPVRPFYYIQRHFVQNPKGLLRSHRGHNQSNA